MAENSGPAKKSGRSEREATAKITTRAHEGNIRLLARSWGWLGNAWSRIRNTGIRELPNMAFQVLIGAVGFLLALVINGWLDDRNETATYHSLLAAVRTEARANQDIINDSYAKYFDSGIVLKEFGYTTATNLLASAVFIKHASQLDIETLSSYVHDLSLANGYRRTSEDLTLHPTANSAGWLSSIKNTWGTEMADVSKDIERVLKIND